MECFTINSSEIGNRLDCHFYRPEFSALDKKIKSISKNKLADYILSISGGATPNIKESKKYYTDSPDGIPFLRVQNVTPEGLNLEGVKFINRETHTKTLKRSQVNEYNLLIKITGVGRMAVSAVAPKGFIGNINQHLVVIKTKSEDTSNVLAVFLNSDIGETLATKRATGGTRPALDYEALKSIPIVFKPEVVDIYEKAIMRKKKIEVEVQRLLDSINDYVIGELGIKLPELKDKMCYAVNSDEVKDNRGDAYYYQPKFEEVEKAIKKGKFEVKKLKDSFKNGLIKGRLPKKEEKEGDVKVLQIKNVLRNGLINISEYVTAKNIFEPEHKIKKEEVIVVITGATIGKVGLWSSPEDFYLGGDMVKFSTNNKFTPYYIQAFLLSQLGQYQILREITGATNKHLSPDDVEKILISFPPLTVQNKIAGEVKNRMKKAEQLQKEAKEDLEEAKKEVEKMILGRK